MPLSFGLRDEDNEKINNVLKQLMALTHVPENWNEATIEEQLQELGLTMQGLLALSNEHLTQHLAEHHFDWANMEKFADLLAALYSTQGFELKDKALAVYNHIQRESKMFSFDIFNKINLLNK
jgi:hypothetical protein